MKNQNTTQIAYIVTADYYFQRQAHHLQDHRAAGQL